MAIAAMRSAARMLAASDMGAASEPLDAVELGELLAAALILEALALRRTQPFDGAHVDRLRAAAERVRVAINDPASAARAEHDFHRRLVERCGDARLLAVLVPVQDALLEYRRAAPVGGSDPEAIVAALENGDLEAAALRLRATFASTLARLLAGVEARGR
jgi:DNA-binding GntR family transcriptional regulator